MEIVQLGKLAMEFGRINTDNMSSPSGNYSVTDNGSRSGLSTNDMLELYNDEVLVYRLPAIIYTAIMMILGLPGNMVVFYIYFFKWRQTTSRIFILFIAALDMLNCATTLPMEIFIMRNSVKLNKPILCKVTRFSTYAMNSASAIILVGIAVDRFIHICKPHSRSFSSKTSKYVCVAAILFAIASTWPSFFLYGTRVLDLGKFEGYACLLQNKYDHTPYPLMYLGVIFLITMLLFVVLVIFYCLIGAKIYRHRKSKQKKCNHLTNINEEEEEEPSVDMDSGSHYKLANKPGDEQEATIENANTIEQIHSDTSTPVKRLENNALKEEITSSDQTKILTETKSSKKLSETENGRLSDDINSNKTATKRDIDGEERVRLKERESNTRPKPCISPRRKEVPNRMMSTTSTSSGTRSSCSSNRLASSVKYFIIRGASTIRKSDRNKCTKCVTVRIGRSTLMLFLITLAYILSFVPFYIIVIIRQSNEMFVQALSKSELMAYHLFLRSYLLSSAINPFIYSFCNAQFREYCRDLFLHVILRRPQSSTMSKLQRRY